MSDDIAEGVVLNQRRTRSLPAILPSYRTEAPLDEETSDYEEKQSMEPFLTTSAEDEDDAPQLAGPTYDAHFPISPTAAATIKFFWGGRIRDVLRPRLQPNHHLMQDLRAETYIPYGKWLFRVGEHLADLARLVDVDEANVLLVEQVRRRRAAKRNLVEPGYAVDVDVCGVVGGLERRVMEKGRRSCGMQAGEGLGELHRSLEGRG
jgi:hypothetical protein